MRTGIILVAASAVFSTSCATVDLQNMAGPHDTVTSAQSESEGNVVQRAVQHLRDAFASRGFGAKSSQRKMQAAADMLLNGLSAQSLSSVDGDYATDKSPAMILDDIQIARGHVQQTTRAAEVYLEVAASDRDLDEELQSLEAALLASERAVQMFEAVETEDTRSSLDSLRLSVDELRLVTDEFGARVRMSKSDKLGIDAASRVG